MGEKTRDELESTIRDLRERMTRQEAHTKRDHQDNSEVEKRSAKRNWNKEDE